MKNICKYVVKHILICFRIIVLLLCGWSIFTNIRLFKKYIIYLHVE